MLFVKDQFPIYDAKDKARPLYRDHIGYLGPAQGYVMRYYHGRRAKAY